MKRYWIGQALKFVVIAAIAIGAFGYVVMSLWNWLVPSITGWHAIDFGQAVALLVLCRILFGGFRGHGRGHWRMRMRERWDEMTPEERERFRTGFGRHCRSRTSEDRAA
jgi:hypothetical protein